MKLLTNIHTHMKVAPDAPALVGNGHITTFGMLAQRVQAIRNWLIRRQDSATLLIFGHKEAEGAAAMLACMFEGQPFVFVDQSNPADRVKRIAKTAGAKQALCTTHMPDVDGIETLMLSDFRSEDMALAALPDIEDTVILYTVFTSGSTGEPKGLPVSRANFAAFCSWYVPMLDEMPALTREPALSGHVNHASFSFDMGMLDLWPVLSLGRPVFLLDHRNNAVPRKNLDALSTLQGVGAQSWFATPSLLQIMCVDPAFDAKRLPHMRCFYVGGEVVPRGLIATLMQRFPQAEIRHAYGPTEVTCVTNIHTLTKADITGQAQLPLGRCLAPNRIQIVDERGNEVPDGTQGEVTFSGPQVVSGYIPVSHPANKAFNTRNGTRVYHTGDFGKVNANGELTLVGRIDRQVKWNGNRIELDEIERAAQAIDGVYKCGCVPIKKDGRVTDIILFVQRRTDAKLDHATLGKGLSSALPQAMVPRDTCFVDRLPVTLNGKLDASTLLEIYRSQGLVDA
ncbi:MAG: AMP-binding protein [Aliishimia sp.]